MSGKLHVQAAQGRRYVEYYDSHDATLNYAQKKFAEHFGELFRGWRDNFAPLIVDSISERLSIKGFRLGGEDTADDDAWKIWQRSYLDADSNAAHIDSLVQGTSFLCVWADEEGEPVIVPESASEVTVQYTPGSRRQLEAGYREFIDDWGVIHSTLWLPNGVYTAQKGATDYRLDDEGIDNPLGVVPIVPLTNRKRLRASPFSELAAILPIQDAINKVAADAIVASEFAAFPQRVITGMEEFEDADEEKETLLKAYIDRILTFDGDVKVDQFDAADLGNYVSLIDMLVQHMASQSRVPFHYFLLNGGQAPSGESITAAEAGLVAKARERMLHFGESWETAMRLAFKVLDDPRAEAFDAETIWSDPEHRSKSALMDSLVKAKEIGVPDKQLQEDYGYSFQQIERFKEMREEQDQEELSRLKNQAAITGEIGGSALAGNGTKSAAPKSASVERQREKNARE